MNKVYCYCQLRACVCGGGGGDEGGGSVCVCVCVCVCVVAILKVSRLTGRKRVKFVSIVLWPVAKGLPVRDQCQ